MLSYNYGGHWESRPLLFSIKEQSALFRSALSIVKADFSGIENSWLHVYLLAGVAPGIFRRGPTLSTRGLKYGFQGTINAKNLRKIAFHLPTGSIAPSPPLAPSLLPSQFVLFSSERELQPFFRRSVLPTIIRFF